MSKLFSPFKIRGTTFKNRVWVSPMCQYSAINGLVGDWHLVHLGSFATGGAGLILAEATGIVPDARISISCPGIWNDQHVIAWKKITDFVHSQDTLVGIQLAHSGRKGSTMPPWSEYSIAKIDDGGWKTVSSSEEPFEGFPQPRELSTEDVREVILDFESAAKRAVAAGFDVIEIHAAHGYLLHQFYSPLTNFRKDEFGGTFENRIRLLVEISKSVRSVMPSSMPLFIRISATDYTEGGWDIKQSIELAKHLKNVGVDLIDVSSGGNVANASIAVSPGYQVDFSSEIRKNADIATSSVGLITDPVQAEEIISFGKSDAVMMARSFIRNPRWALNAAEQLGVEIKWPNQLDRGRTLNKTYSPFLVLKDSSTLKR